MTEQATQPPQPSLPLEPVDAIRAEIDQVDQALLQLIARRISLADGLAPLKDGDGNGLPMRPAREVRMLRRLVGAAAEPVDPELVVELWRVLIGANIRRQGPIDVAIGGGNDPVKLHDVARRHFGARTRIVRQGDPQSALLQAIEQPNTVAVVPWPAAPGVGAWWPALSELRFRSLSLVAGLPLKGPESEDPQAAVFALAKPEPAEHDITMMIVFDRHRKAARAIADVGLTGREVARNDTKALLRVNGFVAPDDARVAQMERAGLDDVRVLGSYARV